MVCPALLYDQVFHEKPTWAMHDKQEGNGLIYLRLVSYTFLIEIHDYDSKTAFQ